MAALLSNWDSTGFWGSKGSCATTADFVNVIVVTSWRSTGGVRRLIRLVQVFHRQGSFGALLHYSRPVFGFIGILLLSVLVLATAARRPYLHQVAPGVHTPQASLITQTHQAVAPRPQPARASVCPDSYRRLKPSFPIREVVFQKPPWTLRLHALRSPPIV